MKPVHIVSDSANIAPIVLMPGDPLRAKYIAENFLENVILVNRVRNMLGYTGFYKGVRITVMSSGMGMPSMGIYAYELIKFYNVKKIIRIGSAGSLSKSVKIRDLVVATYSKTISTFSKAFSNEIVDTEYADEKLVEEIKELASQNVHFGGIVTSDTFDVYTGIDHVLANLSYSAPLAVEMEAFALYHIGRKMGVQTATILTVVDSKFEPNVQVTSKEREESLDEMIKLSLEVIIK